MPRMAEITMTTEPQRATKTPEDRLLAALLRMVLEHCTNDKGALDSWAFSANSEAMQLLAEAGFIRTPTSAAVSVQRCRRTSAPFSHAWASHPPKPMIFNLPSALLSLFLYGCFHAT
jgi:hypothetical protein